MSFFSPLLDPLEEATCDHGLSLYTCRTCVGGEPDSFCPHGISIHSVYGCLDCETVEDERERREAAEWGPNERAIFVKSGTPECDRVLRTLYPEDYT